MQLRVASAYYAQVDFVEVISKVDAVIDTISGDYDIRSLRVLRSLTALVSLSGPNDAPPREVAHEHVVRSGFMLVEPDYAGLMELASLAAAGRLRAQIRPPTCPGRPCTQSRRNRPDNRQDRLHRGLNLL